MRILEFFKYLYYRYFTNYYSLLDPYSSDEEEATTELQVRLVLSTPLPSNGPEVRAIQRGLL